MQNELLALEKKHCIGWREYRIGDLFEKLDLKRLKEGIFDKQNEISKIRNEEFDLPLVNAKNGDNGIMYYARSSDYESAEMTLDIVGDGAVSTGNVYPQPERTGVLYNAYLVKPKWEIVTKNQLLFMAPTVEKSIKLKFGYENKAGWEKVKFEKITLPTANNEIAFDYIEEFIATLDAERLATLDAYLTTTNLKDYTLTSEEAQALADIDKVEWGEFKIGELFEIKPTKNYGLTNQKLFETKGETPVVSNTSINNGITGYIGLEPTEKGNMIIFSDTTTDEGIFYQPNDFVGYSHVQGMHPKVEHSFEKFDYLYIATAFKKAVRGKYNYGTKMNRESIAKEKIQLPIKSAHTPDYAFMTTYIKAMQKVVIKNVVEWADKRIAKTKEAVEKSTRHCEPFPLRHCEP
ncbi:MAG: restriction endonuclease subunit S [Lentimicrobiaceae bacterium]|jgi:hypothetical protein|nr:restriction endonuclease subunit S [Lentimicrobiaceae bacterium]